MNTEPQTLPEYKIAHDKLKADYVALKREFEDYKADAEEIVRRYKAKFGSLNAEPRPSITRVKFGG
jgi:hypothetical protein